MASDFRSGALGVGSSPCGTYSERRDVILWRLSSMREIHLACRDARLVRPHQWGIFASANCNLCVQNTMGLRLDAWWTCRLLRAERASVPFKWVPFRLSRRLSCLLVPVLLVNLKAVAQSYTIPFS